jgi:hypothetical protein
MSVIVACLAAVVALQLALLLRIHRRLDALPLHLRSIVKEERPDGEAALAALHEAAATKAALIVAGIRSFHDQLDANLRTQLADAEVRARLSERRSSEAGVALTTASRLVRELRNVLDRFGLPAPSAAETSPRPPPPSVAPPGSAEPLPPGPGQVAAGLSRPASTRPHAPPRKRETLVGIHPPAPPAEADGDRPSDEEATRVGPRPEVDVTGTAKTLASMRSVVPASKKVGAP